MEKWSRRTALKTGALASAFSALHGRSLALQFIPNTGERTVGPAVLSLNGTAWILYEEDTLEKIPAQVPGCTFLDLMRVGRIKDPYFREDEGECSWVAERNWIYEREFEIPETVLAAPSIDLVCGGLDTIAAVYLNDNMLGAADNMFRSWRFPSKSYLKPGRNTLRIQFDALTPYVLQRAWAADKWYGLFHSWAEAAYVRKAPYMWGWDFSCKLLTQGIWKDIAIEAYTARLTDLRVQQHHRSDGSVSLAIQSEAVGNLSGCTVRTVVLLGTTVVSDVINPVSASRVLATVEIQRPQLWWPNGLGEHPLYTVATELIAPSGQSLDRLKRRIGLRTVEVIVAQDEVSKHVRINGIPVFLKGADWAAADSLPTLVTADRIRWYIEQAAHANFNFIRLHGAEYYEEDALFDYCDELGIMLQFEFKLANNVYPVKDPRWMDNVRSEVEEQICRCRNHPSIVIWSGNNEVSFFDGYNELFRDLIGGAVQRLVPGAFYEVGSGGAAGVKLTEIRKGDQIDIQMSGTGDVHACRVWHLDAPLETYHDIQGFIAEVGIQSFPAPRSVATYTVPSDRIRLTTPAMSYHDRDVSGNGFGVINFYDSLYFGSAPASFDDVLWLSQVTQAWGLRYGIEFWRRSRPRSMATVIWQYNDCWPSVTWSMIDYYRRLKAVQYQARHFFAPILVSGTPDQDTGLAELHVTNDRRTPLSAFLRWCVTDLAGNILEEGNVDIAIAPCSSDNAHTLDLSKHVSTRGASNLLLWTEVVEGSETVACNTLIFVRPRELRLFAPHLSVETSGRAGEYTVRVEADVPALWVWLDLEGVDAVFSDNFVNIHPLRPVMLTVRPDKPMTLAEFRNVLRVRSIYDIAPTMRRV